MKRILVGVDGSDASAAALGWAGRMASLLQAEIVVANVFMPDEAEVSPDHYQELWQDAGRRLAGEWSEPLTGGGVPHTSLLLAGSPERLLEAIENADADLLVIGPRGRGGFARLHIGSVAHHLVHNSNRPLAIVPTPGAHGGFNRLVVGVDGSKASELAVRWCADVARALNAEVIAVYAFEPFLEWVPESDRRSWWQTVERKLDIWVAPLRDAGVSLRTRIVKDIHPVAALADVVAEEEAGLAVVGARGIGGFVGLRLGHVPLQLVHHAQVPVIVVPAPATADAEGVI